MPLSTPPELDDRESAGLDRRSRSRAAGLDDLDAAGNRGAGRGAEDVLRAAGNARADVAAADNLGAAAEDRGRIGKAPGEYRQHAAARHERVARDAAGFHDLGAAAADRGADGDGAG